jgi:HAD superfamily hydrolase (TIGR01484 family)
MTNNPPPRILATDLDGTLIPLQDDPDNRRDLIALADFLQAQQFQLVFVTGRHLSSVRGAIEQHCLPAPDWIICDVGTSIYARHNSPEFELVTQYQQHQRQIIASVSIDRLRSELTSLTALRLQEEEKQGEFKLSFYADAVRMEELVGVLQQRLHDLNAPYSIVQSVSPFTGDGLIDLLPNGVSKAHALQWWCQFAAVQPESIVFAGDSGNDFAALTAGFRSIVVGNADVQLITAVQRAHDRAGWRDRLYTARGRATSGVLEGCRWYAREMSQG